MKMDSYRAGQWHLLHDSLFHLRLSGSSWDGVAASLWQRPSWLDIHSKFPSKEEPQLSCWLSCASGYRHANLMFCYRLKFIFKFFIFFFLCCRLASSELNIKKILRGETARPADCFFPKWMRWWTHTFIYINNQLKGPRWMWAFIFDDTLIVTINNNIFIVG